jgi:hypothetical protein
MNIPGLTTALSEVSAGESLLMGGFNRIKSAKGVWRKEALSSDADKLDGHDSSYFAAADSIDPLKINTNVVMTEDVTIPSGETRIVTGLDTNGHTLTIETGAEVIDITSQTNNNYITDSRGAVRAPNYYKRNRSQWDFQNKADTLAGGDTWHAINTISKWSSWASSHPQEQVCYTGDKIKHRVATSDTVWGSWRTVMFTTDKAADADKLDGINSSQFLRSDSDDTFSGWLTSSSRNKGLCGTYDSTKTDQIWSIGTAYKNSSSGTDFGNLYGLAYKHTNNSTGGTMAGGHQMVWCSNGTPKTAMGDNLWTSGDVRWQNNDRLTYDDGNNRWSFEADGKTDNAKVKAGSFEGVATSAKYADIAERYHADTNTYKRGDVLGVGGKNEVTLYKKGMKLAGVVSTHPGFKMNDDEENRRNDMPFIALKGRVPVNVKSAVKRGDYIIADDNGVGIGVSEITTTIEQNLLIGVCLNIINDNTVEVKI